MFRFLEVAIKRILFHLAKSATQHKLFFRVWLFLIILIQFFSRLGVSLAYHLDSISDFMVYPSSNIVLQSALPHVLL